MYKVIKRFYDLQNDHAYSVGDVFPHNGVEIDENRIVELESNNNRLGFPLIEAIAEKSPPRKRKKAREN